MKKKSHPIRRSLLWGVLLAGAAGTLTATTRPVHAESITSSEIAAATSSESGAPTVKPFAWTQSVINAVQSLAFISGALAPPNRDYYLAAVAGGINQPAFRALSVHALD